MKINKALIIGVVALPLLLAGCGKSSSSNTANKFNDPIVTAKDTKVTAGDLYTDTRNLPTVQSQFQQILTANVLDTKYGKDVSKDSVNQQYNKYKTQYGSQMDETLKNNGYTKSSFKKTLRNNLVLQAALRKNINPTEKQLKAQYKEYHQPVTIQHIKVKSASQAKSIIKQLQNGGNFKELTRKYTTDTTTLNNGGKLDPFDNSSSTIDDNVKQAAFSTKSGKLYAKPIQTASGYEIIKVISNPGKGKYNAVKTSLKSQYVAAQMGNGKVTNKILYKILKPVKMNFKDDSFQSGWENYLYTLQHSNDSSASSSSSATSSSAK